MHDLLIKLFAIGGKPLYFYDVCLHSPSNKNWDVVRRGKDWLQFFLRP